MARMVLNSSYVPSPWPRFSTSLVSTLRIHARTPSSRRIHTQSICAEEREAAVQEAGAPAGHEGASRGARGLTSLRTGHPARLPSPGAIPLLRDTDLRYSAFMGNAARFVRVAHRDLEPIAIRLAGVLSTDGYDIPAQVDDLLNKAPSLQTLHQFDRVGSFFSELSGLIEATGICPCSGFCSLRLRALLAWGRRSAATCLVAVEERRTESPREARCEEVR